eukprot:gene624-774_t
MATPIHRPTSKIELRFSCKGLKDLDTLSKSDPQVVVYHQDPISKNWVVAGKTEMIKNNLNPKFKTPVNIDYFFEEVQNLRFEVLDIDDGNNFDFIGQTTCTLASILSKSGCTLVKDLLCKKGKKAGSITVIAEELQTTNQSLKMRIAGQKLDKKDLFGKSDPYFILSKSTQSGFVKVFESEVIKKTLDPIFREFQIKLEELNGGDMNREIKFDFYDWDSIGKHDFIGSFTTCGQELINGRKEFPIINVKKKEKKSSYQNSGIAKFFDVELVREHQFLEYIAGGCEISLIVGIDCTASNRAPVDPTSLHYKHPSIPNQYASAIVSVGNVLAPYDSDNLFPVYGFGGIMPGKSQVSHCFPMGLSDDKLFVNGVEGILDVYYQNISRITLHGPTYFSTLINNAAKIASAGQSQKEQKYTILLIITDGEILDMDNTIDAIINASSLPLSIIIVGVGNADFTNMDILDGDNGLLSNGKRRVERDIVNFVPFSKYAKNPELLAMETLREVPEQFISFMKKHKFVPNPPRMFVPQPSVIPTNFDNNYQQQQQQQQTVGSYPMVPPQQPQPIMPDNYNNGPVFSLEKSPSLEKDQQQQQQSSTSTSSVISLDKSPPTLEKGNNDSSIEKDVNALSLQDNDKSSSSSSSISSPNINNTDDNNNSPVSLSKS